MFHFTDYSTNSIRNLLKKSKENRNQRQNEYGKAHKKICYKIVTISHVLSEHQHHQIFFKKNKKLGKRMRTFFEMPCSKMKKYKDILSVCNKQRKTKKSYSKTTDICTIFYWVLILCVFAGVDSIFDNKSMDPFLSTSINDCNKRTEMIVQTLQARIFEVNVSDEVEHEFMTSSKLRQREIYNTLLFEYQNNDVHFFNCTSCHGRYFWTGGIENSRTKCDDCISSNLSETKLLQENMLPVWKDDNGKTRFDQPEELQDLSYGEMLCIQVKALLFPSTHLWNGKYGLKGHTVVFNKDITSVVDELPRSKVEVVNVMRNYSKGDEIKVQNFRIRKSKIMKALTFLKKHHPSYKNITIKESNLDWCGDDENATILQCIECDETKEEPENQETVSEKQTIQDEELLESYGIALNEAMDKENPESNEMLKDLQVHDKGVCLDYPQISEEPVDEYLEPHLFADIYPWCVIL